MRYRFDKYSVVSILFTICLSIIFQNSIIHADCPSPAPVKVDVVDAKGDYDRTWNKVTRLEAKGRFLEAKRAMAVIVCDSSVGEMDQKLDNFILATAFLNTHGQLEAWKDTLKLAKTYIDKLQNWAVINNETNAHVRDLYTAEQTLCMNGQKSLNLWINITATIHRMR